MYTQFGIGMNPNLIVHSLIFFFSFSLLFGQTDNSDTLKTDIFFEFVKSDTELEQAGSFFNVLILRNTTAEVFEAKLRLTCPEGWKFIGQRSYDVLLLPGEEQIVPLRISVPPSVIGGVSYLLNAELVNTDYYNYASSYVSIKPFSKWKMYTDKDVIYLSQYMPQNEFSVRLENLGNSSEMIKLRFDTGELLEYLNPMVGDSVVFVDMGAYSDTVLVFRVRERDDLSNSEYQAFKRNWKASSILFSASTDSIKTNEGVRVITLDTKSESDIRYRNSPLNLSLSMNNLLTDNSPRISGSVSGKLLFPDYQQLQYNFGFTSFYLDAQRNEDFDIYQQIRMKIRYTDRNTYVELGDRMGLGELHTLSGQGIRARHTLLDKHTIYFNGVNNVWNDNLGVFAGYSTNFGSLGLNTGITMETNRNNSNGIYSLHLGGSQTIFKRHKIRLLTVTSINNFNGGDYISSDTSTIGLAYRFTYGYNGQKLKLRFDNVNTRLSYLRNSGIQRFTFRGEYIFKPTLRIEANGFRNDLEANQYPYSFIYSGNQNITDNGQILLSHTRENRTYMIGPYFTNSVRKSYNGSSNTFTEYRNLQPGLLGSVSYRLGTLKTLTPYIRLNNMYVGYDAESNPDFNPQWTKVHYTLGVSYYDQAFKLNTYFTSGESTDIYRSLVVEEDPIVNRSIQIRPYYERYFMDEALRLSGYLSYSYYMPSDRDNMMFNLTSDYYMDKGWRLFLSFNVYRITRVDEQFGKISSSDLNLLSGVKKSFDLQQPRLSYHDLVIVGFNDINGNGIREDNEKPIANVLIVLSRDEKKNINKKVAFSESTFITDPNGEITYEGIPEGTYDLKISALSNLGNLYFLNGENQSLEVRESMIHYLPLVESYKVKGKIIMDRDPNSNEGNISLEGIRVSATSEDGDTYSTLSDDFGSYILTLPKAAIYEVSIYNVFGEQFQLEQGRYRVQFTANKTINLDFKFKERRRQIQFQEGEQFFDFNIKRDN